MSRLFTNHFMKKNKNLQDIIVVIQMHEIVKIQMHFRSYYLIFWFNFLNKCLDIGKKIRMKFIYFHLHKI